jgi:outer membrane protein assembly factor BamA
VIQLVHRVSFIVLIGISMGAASLQAVTLTLDAPINAQQERELTSALPANFFLEQVTFLPDVFIDAQELNALFDVSAQKMVKREDVVNGLGRLFKKQKFKQISLEINKGEINKAKETAIRLKIATTSFWTFLHLQFTGSLIGKDRYREYYMLEPGEQFDEKKHKAGIEKIKQALAAAGYFNAEVTDTFFYDKQNKAVTVYLALNPQKQFIIDEVDLQIASKDHACEKDCQSLMSAAQKILQESLSGAAYSKKILDDAARALQEFLINKGFLNSTIELEEAIDQEGFVRVSWFVTLTYRNIFEFYGNHFFTRRELLNQILLFGKSAELIPPSLIAEELIALYKKVGFWAVEITWQDDGERIFFFIKEGKRVGVSSVRIHGAQALSEAMLIKDHFKAVFKARYFDGELLKKALDGLGQAYLKAGFWDITISNYDYKLQENGSYLLDITINEGKRRWLTSILLPPEYNFLKQNCTLTDPRPFDIGIIQEQRQELTKALQKQGYLNLRVRPEFVEQGAGLQLQWKFLGSAEKVRFGDTILLGSSRLPSHVILRELAYKKGDVWDQHKIEESVKRLKSLGIFEVISLAPENLSSAETEKTLLLKHVEDTPYELRARLGIQGVNRNIIHFSARGLSYKAGGSFLYKNPFNKGDYFRFDLDFSRFMHDIIATYHIPWLFNQPIRTDFKVYSTRYDQPVVLGSPDVLYRAAQDGMLVGLTRQFSTFDMGLNVGAEGMSIKPSSLLPWNRRPEALSRALQLDRRLIDHTFPYLFLEPTFYRSSLDNKVQPTRGLLTLISVKGMLPPTLSDTAFIKVILEQSIYFPLPLGTIDPWVLALRGRCGTIFNKDFKRIIPIERFFLGGAYSVRSYEPDLVPPLNPLKDNCGKRRLVPIGGKSMLNVNAELRFPIYGSVSGVTFLDFGALSKHNIHAVALNNVVGAAGFGLRLNTVVGPIRFDIGWKINNGPKVPGVCNNTRPYAWFLTLGNAF